MPPQFDDLFNEFFGRKRDNHDSIRKILDSLMNFKSIPIQDAELEQSILEKLGEPSEVDKIIKEGMCFTKYTWNTPQGKFVKIIVTDAQTVKEDIQKPKETKKTLEQQLEDAIAIDDFETAIVLRDKIKALKAELEGEKPAPKKRTRKKP